MNQAMEPPPAVIRPNKKRDLTDNDSQSQLSDESSAIDSSRAVAPKPRRKRQRTFLSAFSSITLQKKETDSASEEDDDANSSKAVADEGDECGNSVTSSLEDDLSQEDRFLSDKEEAERKVMLELVFGPDKETSDVVDSKLEGLIRQSIQKATKMGSVDDMELDASYQRSNDASTVTSFTTCSMKRSNSLPSMFDDTMEVDLSGD